MRDFTVNTCHSPCHLRRSVGETLRNNQTGKSLFWVWKDRVASRDLTPTALYVLPLWAATASLPFCLYPNTKSIHSWRFSDTCWLSSAVLFFWRKSLGSGQTRDTARGKQTTLRWAVEQLDQSNQEKKKKKKNLKPTVEERHHQPGFRSAFGPNPDSACFPESCCRCRKTQGSATWKIFFFVLVNCCSVISFQKQGYISQLYLTQGHQHMARGPKSAH